MLGTSLRCPLPPHPSHDPPPPPPTHPPPALIRRRGHRAHKQRKERVQTNEKRRQRTAPFFQGRSRALPPPIRGGEGQPRFQGPPPPFTSHQKGEKKGGSSRSTELTSHQKGERTGGMRARKDMEKGHSPSPPLLPPSKPPTTTPTPPPQRGRKQKQQQGTWGPPPQNGGAGAFHRYLAMPRLASSETYRISATGDRLSPVDSSPRWARSDIPVKR